MQSLFVINSKMMATRSTPSSPPPNCAICLGSFSNKCFSDSCMHQFCFKCLLEWSKIKAECPLCKQPFKRIIHNVKSNEEYDEHVVEITRPDLGPDEIHIIDTEELLYLPPQPTTRHHFHFRTTFTVDTRGEHAIQQMLLHHPITSGGQISVEGFIPSRNLYQRRRRDNTSTSFRRSIYHRNLWVSAPPDVTGRYRDISPAYFRDCPGARTRLVPWLNRELNALLYEDTRLVMHLVDVILDHLPRHHICGRIFRNLLVVYLDNKTDHFIHEFYNFMRSPFDMVGYDRHVVYTDAPRSPPPYVLLPDDDPSDDSDVIIVDSYDPRDPVVIDLVNTDSDEPILVTQDEPMPVPVQEPVPVVDVTSAPEVDDVVTPSTPAPLPAGGETPRIIEDRPPLLPLKLRFKRKRQSGEKEQMEERRKRRRFLQRKRLSTDRSESVSSSTTSSSSSSSSSSSESTDELWRYMRKRKLHKLMKKKCHRNSSEREVNVTNSSSSDSSDDDLPLSSRAGKKSSSIKQKRKSGAKKGKLSSSRGTDASNQGTSKYPALDSTWTPNRENPERSYTPPPKVSQTSREVFYSPADRPSCSNYSFPSSATSGTPHSRLIIKSEDSTDEDYPLTHLLNKNRMQVQTDVKLNSSNGSSNEGLRNLMIKKEADMWYAYPCFKSDVSDC
ncbi:unnamed protein product [Callosobruchus maculatus]|uniref:E3 ubiquitin-protein ligase Topors n=2 Tax=Callosobruchus maculatus TaxID=64391 RepID=A0A653CEE4_CALMS|nr:unnamed protein product [Callosobruchus maculatus]